MSGVDLNLATVVLAGLVDGFNPCAIAVLLVFVFATTMRNVYQNLFGAFVYNSLGLPVALGVLYPIVGILLSPILAAAAMSLSSVTVITNASRLGRFTPTEVSA